MILMRFLILWLSAGIYLYGTAVSAHEGKEQAHIKSIEYKQTQIRDAARILAEQSGMNIVVTNEASNRQVTLYLQDVHAEDVLATICKVAGLWYRKNISSKVYRIMTTAEYAEDIKVFQDFDTKIYSLSFFNGQSIAEAIAALYEGRVIISKGSEIVPYGFKDASNLGDSNGVARERERGAPNNQIRREHSRNVGTGGHSVRPGGNLPLRDKKHISADLAERLSVLEGDYHALPSSAINGASGDESLIYVALNQEHNILLIRTSDPAVFEDIDKLVDSLDKPVPQVLLEMKIISLGVDDSFRSMFSYTIEDDYEFLPEDAPSFSLNDGEISDIENLFTLTPKKILGLGNFPLQGGTLTYQFISDKVLSNIELQKTDNNTKLLSAPVVMASNHRPAKMFVGEEVVLTRGADRETITPNDGPARDIITLDTEIRDVGTILEVVPRINQDETITLAIRQESSSIAPDKKLISVSGTDQNITIPLDTIITTELEGTIIAKDGLTVAVGGLFKKNKIDEKTKVPLLGDIPFFGRLFRKEITGENVTELILLITPRIVYDTEELDTANLENVLKRNTQDPREALEHLSANGKQKLRELAISAYQQLAGQINGKHLQDIGIESVYVPTLYPQEDVNAYLLKSWRHNDTYVHAVRLSSSTNMNQRIDPLAFNGEWQALSLMEPELRSGARQIVLFFSHTPFFESLHRYPAEAPVAGE